VSAQRQRLLDEAQWAIEHRQFDRAIRAYRQLAEGSPDSISIGLKLGELYLKIGAQERAINTYWTLAQAEQTRERRAHLKTLLSLVLRLQPSHLEARLQLIELMLDRLEEGEGEAGSDRAQPEALEAELSALLKTSGVLQAAEQLATLERVLSRSVDRFLSGDSPSLAQLRTRYAHRCAELGRHAEGLPYYVWCCFEGSHRDLERFGLLALASASELSLEVSRLLRLRVSRAMLSASELSPELTEQVYVILEPLIEAPVELDPEAHLCLARLMRAQGHHLHADALLHSVGQSAVTLERRSLAVEAYDELIRVRPHDHAAREALAELHSSERLLVEAGRSYELGAYEHALEYIRVLIDRGRDEPALYELLIKTAEVMGLEELTRSARAALSHEPTADEPAPSESSVPSMSSLLHAPSSELMSRPELPEGSELKQSSPELSSALDRARAQWAALSDEQVTLNSTIFTPAPLQSSSERSEAQSLTDEPQELESPVEPSAPEPLLDEGELSEPIVSLPPLMSELIKSGERSLQPETRVEEPPLDSEPKLERQSRTLSAYLTPHEGDEPELFSLEFAQAGAHEKLRETSFEQIDPLTLFDSGTSFEGAISGDHPLAIGGVDELFTHEDELSETLDARLAQLQYSGEPLVEDPTPVSDELISEMLSLHEALITELQSEAEISASFLEESAPERLDAQRLPRPSLNLSSGILSPLAERFSSIKGRALSESQLRVTSLIEAQEYELALSLIPPHLKTSSIHYLKGLCLYGLGHSEEALELIELTLSCSLPSSPAYFYALAAELYDLHKREDESERCLLELLSQEPELGALVYQHLRS